MKVSMFRRAGPLTIIAAILVLSAAMRLAGLSTEAFALDNADELEAQVGKTDDQSNNSGDLDAVLQSFQRREAQIIEQEAQIEKRLAELKTVETDLQTKLEGMEQAEARLRELLSIASTAAEDDVARLTEVYENMKPKEAATVFEQMQPEFAAGFLGRMRPDAAAAIMAGLSPQTAYAISVTLAGRHSNQTSNNREN